MKYTKTICKIFPDNEINRDLLVATLGELGYDSFVSEGDTLDAYVQTKLYNTQLIEDGALDFAPMYTVETQSEEVPDQNWNEVWEQESFKEMLIANKILIRAVGPEKDSSYPYQIEIVPNMSFGTGDHQTTAMILELLLEIECQGKQVLDMGCGTGILGIMAAKRGADIVDAIDIDPWCFDSTTKNSEINNVNLCLNPILGDANAIPETKIYDVIFANIHKNILIQDMHRYASVQRPGGKIFMSGFFVSDVSDMIDYAKKKGYKSLSVNEKDDWAVVEFIRV
ncbi:50S ribosomal protein L11 methyltransferase [Halosquirtibacter xylanolyticus]|uniref:50S ribosomal protein L11 methyltransferase n=1 Tax=Halosquirtibacter xylanolyticus TaxID=3374599 RepID=UPI003747A479|nr:50S ribosomal protein L11 methyltransferase [Prolixibacteraceae bacterium]